MFSVEEGMVVCAGTPEPTGTSWGTIGWSCVPIDVCWIMKDQLRRITVRIEKKNEDVT